MCSTDWTQLNAKKTSSKSKLEWWEWLNEGYGWLRNMIQQSISPISSSRTVAQLSKILNFKAVEYAPAMGVHFYDP